jgi:hypothetical protein
VNQGRPAAMQAALGSWRTVCQYCVMTLGQSAGPLMGLWLLARR